MSIINQRGEVLVYVKRKSNGEELWIEERVYLQRLDSLDLIPDPGSNEVKEEVVESVIYKSPTSKGGRPKKIK